MNFFLNYRFFKKNLFRFFFKVMEKRIRVLDIFREIFVLVWKVRFRVLRMVVVFNFRGVWGFREGCENADFRAYL